MVVSNTLPKMVFLWVKKLFTCLLVDMTCTRPLVEWMTCNTIPKTTTTLYIFPFFWMMDKLSYTFLCTNVLNMTNPGCIVHLIQDLLIEVDTSCELCFLTCLASRSHQSTLKCMPYNGLLIVVVWLLLGELICFP